MFVRYTALSATQYCREYARLAVFYVLKITIRPIKPATAGASRVEAARTGEQIRTSITTAAMAPQSVSPWALGAVWGGHV